jgi:hypothetical protein
VHTVASTWQAAEIAGELYPSVNTARTHMRHLYDKLDVHRRTEAVKQARALGLLAPPRVGPEESRRGFGGREQAPPTIRDKRRRSAGRGRNTAMQAASPGDVRPNRELSTRSETVPHLVGRANSGACR